MSFVVALVSVTPLYLKLKSSQEEDLQANLSTRILSVNLALKRKIDIARQVTSRTSARQLLADYRAGAVAFDDLEVFQAEILRDAIVQTDSLVGVLRFNADARIVSEAGVTVPDRVRGVLEFDTSGSTLTGPIEIDGAPHLLITTPILSELEGRVGTDVAVFTMSELRKLVFDTSGLGQSGEMILARETDGEIHPFFTRSDRYPTLSLEFRALLRTAIADGRSGSEYIADRAVVFDAVPETDWAIALRMERDELYASVGRDLAIVGIAVFSVSAALATIGLIVVLRPLIRRVIDADELEREVTAKADALEELKETQIQLVHSEKMSSLGQLVAGIAHEINNPVGFIHGNLAHVEEYSQNRRW
ncbi:MAG: hypothetical protein ACFB9N_12610 [Geitlerinemataceae cyanobacterium]